MTSCNPCGADPSKYCPLGSSEQQSVGPGNYSVGVAGSFWPDREPPPDTAEGFRCDERTCDRGSVCVDGGRLECPSGKVCPFTGMVTAITCVDRHATADRDTYEHGTMVQVRCECKANFYAWSMKRRLGGGAGVALAVPLASLSDNATIHKLTCEVCPEVHSSDRPRERLPAVHIARAGLRAECSLLSWRAAAPGGCGHAPQTPRRTHTGGCLRPSGHRLPQPRPREDLLAEAPVLRPPAVGAVLRELHGHPHDGRSMCRGRLERHVPARLVQPASL